MPESIDVYWRQILRERSTGGEAWPPDLFTDRAGPRPQANPEPAVVASLPPMVRAALHHHLLLREEPGFAAAVLKAARRVELAAGRRLVEFRRPGEAASADERCVWLLLEGEAKLVYRRRDPRVPELHLDDVDADLMTMVGGRLGAGTWVGLPRLAWYLVCAEHPDDPVALGRQRREAEAELSRLRQARTRATSNLESAALTGRIERAMRALREVQEALVRTEDLPTDYAIEVLPRRGHVPGRAAVALCLEMEAAVALCAQHPAFQEVVLQAVNNTYGEDPRQTEAMDRNPLLRYLDPGRRHLLLQLAAARRVSHGAESLHMGHAYLHAGGASGRVALLVRGQGQAFLPASDSGEAVLVGDFGPGELVGHERLFGADELASADPLCGVATEPPRATDIYLDGGTELLEVDWQSLRWLLAEQAATRVAALNWYRVGGDDQSDQPARVVAFVADGPGLGLTTLAVGTAIATAFQMIEQGARMHLDDVEQRPIVDRSVVVLDLQGEQNWQSRWRPQGFRKVDAGLGPGGAGGGFHCIAPGPSDHPLDTCLPFIALTWPTPIDHADQLLERLRVLPHVRIVLVSGFEGGHGKMAEISGMLTGTGMTVIWVTDDPVGEYKHTAEHPEVLVRVDRLNERYRRIAADLARDVEQSWREGDETSVRRPAAANATIRLPDDAEGAAVVDGGDLPRVTWETSRFPLGRAVHRIARTLLGRSVGLALGGGGMWGAAQIALLRELELAGVPIDYVAGTSFGSVVGGLYAAGGLPALDLLLAESCPDLPRGGPLAVARTLRDSAFFRAMTIGAGRSSRPVQDEVDRLVGLALGRADTLPLACTEIPFLPVSTNLDTCAPFTTLIGTVGFGVRASSGLPPALPGLWRHGQRILDGAMVANVPAEIVRNHGAHYVISANVVAPRQGGLGGHRVLSAAYDLTVRRFTDLQRGLFLLGWKAGDDQGRLRADYRVDLWTHGASMASWWQGQQIVRRTQDRLFQEQLGWSIFQHWTRRTSVEGAAYRRVRADIDVQVEGDLEDRPPRSVAAPGPTAGR